MHDALAMGLFQSVRDLDPVAERFLEWQGALLQSVGEGLPFEVLHHQEVHALLSSDVVKRADVRMVQTGDRARFTLEALSHGDVVGEMGRQHFDGDRPIEPRVLGAINLAHPAGSNRGEDLVGAEPGSPC